VNGARPGLLPRFLLLVGPSAQAPLFWNGRVWRRMNWSFPLGFLCSFTLGNAEELKLVLLEFWIAFSSVTN